MGRASEGTRLSAQRRTLNPPQPEGTSGFSAVPAAKASSEAWLQGAVRPQGPAASAGAARRLKPAPARGGAQVGYGDVVAQSDLGKLAVLAMICVGVVLIPVQTSALYAQLTARRVTLGAAPGRAPSARAPRRRPARRVRGSLCGPGRAALSCT